MELLSLNKSLIYTTDPNMASYKGDDQLPVQGGFLIIKPSLEDYRRLIEVLMIGNYKSGSAWGGTGIGWFWGGKTIQGLLAYYYNRLNPPERSLRVDRCLYNTMADTPTCAYGLLLSSSVFVSSLYRPPSLSLSSLGQLIPKRSRVRTSRSVRSPGTATAGSTILFVGSCTRSQSANSLPLTLPLTLSL
jgi:hypothetical protein